MNTSIVAGLGTLVLLVGIASATGDHYAAAKGMPIHNPNWASIVANPTSQNGHAPAYIASDHAQDNVKTNPSQQKTSDYAKNNALTKANPDNSNIKVGQHPKR